MHHVDADNRLRYSDDAADIRQGHVESHFIKANSPDGERALWIKHTLLAPPQRPEAAVAEVWGIAFAARGLRKLARKQTFPLSALQRTATPFALSVPCAELTSTRARGQLQDLSWDLQLDPQASPFRPFALDGMYSGPFPRSKSLTPVPDAKLHGHFCAFGERWDLAGWRGAQGHNWGVSHAHAYAWAHANAWRREPDAGETLDGVWFESLTGKVRLGPLTTPWLSVAGFAIDGHVHRFDRLRALCSPRVALDPRSYQLELRQGALRLRATFRAPTERFAGLCYRDPDGSALACLNSKLADARVAFYDGAREHVFYSDQAALELGTRAPDHDVEILL